MRRLDDVDQGISRPRPGHAACGPDPPAAELAGVSEDTLRRRRPDKIIQLSPRRQGMRVKDALMMP